ncbi:MAG: hypothetical protein AB1487_09390 [Thermodesulfobacteriota bacterium]
MTSDIAYKEILVRRSPMQQNIEQDHLSAHTRNIRARFDETLGRHIERLIGTRYGIGSLPLNVATIPCLILAVERETDIENTLSHRCAHLGASTTGACSPPERYTEETFLNELAEFGLNPDEDLKASLQDIIQKGYIDAAADGSFSATKPAISMVQLLDRVFPKMPGGNLVAYLVQAMDEVLSGRKKLETAISQFDQTLQMQGASLPKQRPKPKSEQTSVQIFRHRQEEIRSQRGCLSLSTPKVLSRCEDADHFKFKDLFTKKGVMAEVTSDTERRPTEFVPTREPGDLHNKPDVAAKPAKIIPDIPPESAPHDSDLPEKDVEEATCQRVLPTQDAPLPALEPAEQETAPSTGPEAEAITATPHKEEVSLRATPKYETGPAQEEKDADITDELIESRIAAFTEDLTTTCPVCGTGKIQTQKTPTGKLFYVCSDKSCNLISWGKPYHIPCPQCKNPFLIETSDQSGNIILKCPRATCRYRQNPAGETENAVSTWHEAARPSSLSPKPRRKVVRRRVLVRKKR